MAKKKVSKDILDIIANENIIERDVVDEFEESSLNYAVKTISDRALPDVRDGLKPVQRRVLYSMFHHLGLTPDKPHKKSARVAGEVMGKLHPHGSAYGVAVNMANEFSIRYPTIDPQGNFGFPLDGDGPAADRYTEMRLSELGMQMIKDVNKKVVDFKLNYDETEEEPVLLPSAIPHMIVNGSSGIATGYTTEFPSHNLKETIDALIALINNKEITTREIMQYIKGPDLEGGALLIENENIFQLYETGEASLKFRAPIHKEYQDDGSVNLIITELPPDVRKGSTDNSVGIVDKIYNMCIVDKKIARVVAVRDESSTKKDKKTGQFIGSPVRIVIELHKTAVPDAVIKQLYEFTSLEKTKGYKLRALIDQVPHLLSLKETMQYYVEHRREVVFRRTKFELNNAKRKLHIAEGFRIAHNNMDEVIQIIRYSDDPSNELMQKFSLSKEQVTAILDMKLIKLSKLELNKLDQEIIELKEKIDELTFILANSIEVDKIIIEELTEVKNNFGDDRRTKIISENEASNVDSDESMVVILTSNNNFKQLPENAFEDMMKTGTLRERKEVYVQGVRCKTSDEFVIITESGEYARCSFTDILGSLDFLEDKKIAKILVLDNTDENKNVIAVTKKGMIKKSIMKSFRARARRLAPYINLSGEDDKIINVVVTDNHEKNTVVLSTNKATIHRFYEKAFSASNPGGNGVPCISTSVIEEGETIADFTVTNEENDNNALLLLYILNKEEYYEKSVTLDEFKAKGRVSKGIVGAGADFKGEVYDIKIAHEDFFTLDDKGNVNKQKFISIPIQTRYNKPNLSTVSTFVTDFFV